MILILQILAAALVVALALGSFVLAFLLVVAKVDRTLAEATLATAQAAHVVQTRKGDELNSQELIKSYEAQGANKLRTEVARLGGDLAKVEEKLGSKIKGAISLEAHEADLAKSREIILSLEQQIDVLQRPAPAVDPVFNGQPSPGASVPA